MQTFSNITHSAQIKCEKHNEFMILSFYDRPGGPPGNGWVCQSCCKERVEVSRPEKSTLSVYLIGSLRNPAISDLGNDLRGLGFDVFEDWISAGPEADDCWQKYEEARGRAYDEALKGYAAQHVFKFDLEHLERCDAGVLVLPAGKSGHLELGYIIGKGKKGYVLFDKVPERWDVMYNFAAGVFFDKQKLFKALKEEGDDESSR